MEPVAMVIWLTVQSASDDKLNGGVVIVTTPPLRHDILVVLNAKGYICQHL